MDYHAFYQQLAAHRWSSWIPTLTQTIEAYLSPARHGKMPYWQRAIACLPKVTPSHIELAARVEVGCADDLGDFDPVQFALLLKTLHPWRKGPYQLLGTTIDTEWRSDWKWDRVLPHLQDLQGRAILDVGCGNGYHGWRMLGAGAKWVVGIDPTAVFVMQYHLMQSYIRREEHTVLPIGIEQLPQQMACFDTVFSMGVLYHRRSPLDHLMELRGCLRSGGELVLETLIVDGPLGMTLLPKGRYAKMNNVWFLPSRLTLESWLTRCGFTSVRCVDINSTSVQEQRSTDWMTFESLADFLDPQDPQRTIEGYPAPQRAVFVANAP